MKAASQKQANQGVPEVGWNSSQRRALIILLCIFLMVLAIRYATNRRYIQDPQPPQGARAGELASRIDPNTADWQELAAVPQLGERRAKDIVAYRERFLATHPRTTAFRNPSDLRRIRGIGIATVENVKSYLLFPSDRASTAP